MSYPLRDTNVLFFAIQELQYCTLLEFSNKKHQPLQTLIDNLERVLPATCQISETKQELLNVLFLKFKDCSRSSSIALMDLVPEKQFKVCHSTGLMFGTFAFHIVHQ